MKFPIIEDEENYCTSIEIQNKSHILAKYIHGYYFKKRRNYLNISQRRFIIAVQDKTKAMIAIYSTIILEAIYIPLDLKQPSARIIKIFQETQPDLIICDSFFNLLNSPDFPILNIDEIYYENSHKLLGNSLQHILINKEKSEDILAILFTSGSTGTPKGIAISYRSMLSFVNNMINVVELMPGDKIASIAPFHFDLSLFDIFASILRGASVLFIPDYLKASPYNLSKFLDSRSVTHTYTVPSILQMLILKGELEHFDFKALKVIVFAGEVFPIKFLRMLIAELVNVSFFNFFGPTETNVCCYWKVDPVLLDSFDDVPIGNAFGRSLLSINENTGELMVMGDQLMSGYWSSQGIINRIRTDQRYSTGDLVEFNNGLLFFKGRKDKVVKRYGFRIDLLEIESSLLKHPEIKEALVMALNKEEKLTIVSFIASSNKNLNSLDLNRWVMNLIPGYMYIDKFYFYENLYKLCNGKLDIQRLIKDSSC
jgi:acyl-coenzyme A synthetase/AMP-(fatty) acid ligase